MVKKKILYYASTPCTSCGIYMPDLPFCRLTGTCVKCAREKLPPDKCNACPDKDECERALRGLEIFREIEYNLSIVIPDLASVLIEELNNIFEENNIDNPQEKAEQITKIYLAITSTLIKHKGEIPQWLTTVFKPEAIRSLLKLPLNIIKFSDIVESALDEYAARIGIDSTFIKNLLKFLIIRYLSLFRYRSIEEFIKQTFSDVVCRALLVYSNSLSNPSQASKLF